MDELDDPILERIEARILFIRGQRVMLDTDLAVLYGVEVGALNQAVARNAERFPVDFAFRLTDTEAAALKSQSVISNEQSEVTTSGRAVDVRFQGQLRPEQEGAAQALLAHETGVLSAGTAFGKTVVAAYLIAERAVNTLVLVHRQQLLDQ